MEEDAEAKARRVFEEEGERLRLEHIDRVGWRAVIAIYVVVYIMLMFALLG